MLEELAIFSVPAAASRLAVKTLRDASSRAETLLLTPWMIPVRRLITSDVLSRLAACSSTDLLMLSFSRWMRLMIRMILWVSSMASRLLSRMSSSLRPIISVAFAVCRANSFTSLETTEKPLPASPAPAASMAAFRASMLVCSAMALIISTTLSISWAE